MSLFHPVQRVSHGGREIDRSVAAEHDIDGLEPLDEVADFVSGSRTTGGIAKMGAAAEWAAVINLAFSGNCMEKRTTAIGGRDDFLAPRRSPCLRRNMRFAAS